MTKDPIRFTVLTNYKHSKKLHPLTWESDTQLFTYEGALAIAEQITYEFRWPTYVCEIVTTVTPKEEE